MIKRLWDYKIKGGLFIKRKSKIIVALMLLVLFLSISASFAADANNTDNIQTTNDIDDAVALASETETVSSIENTTDSNANDLLESGTDTKLTSEDNYGTYDELNYLIKLSDNEVTLNKNYRYQDSDEAYVDTGIVISKTITIDGNGYTIDGNYLAKAFTINANNVILKNINIINSYTKTSPITWSGDNGQLLNSNFSNTLSTEISLNGGGGVYWSGNNAKVSKCIFENTNGNEHQDSFSFLKFNGVNVEISDSIFRNTDQWTTVRMMLFFDSSAVGTNIVRGCKFLNCTSGRNNAGILFVRGTELTATDCDFINCKSRNTMIYTTGSVIVNHCYFENNSATSEVEGSSEVYDSTFKNSISGSYSVYLGTKVENCVFINNKLIYSENIQVLNSKFENMKTTAVVGQGKNPSIDIEGCEFDNNQVTSNYLIDISKGSNNLLKNNIFRNNVAKIAIVNIGNNVPCIVDNLTFTGNTPQDIINNGVTFDDYSLIYVSDTSIANTGLSRDKSTTLTDALSKIKNGGTIIIMNGTHDLLSGSYSFYCNVIGENNVIINIATLTLNNNYHMESVTLNQTRLVRMGAKSTMNNVNFTNVNGRSIDVGLFNRFGVNVQMSNCNIFNSDFYNKNLFYYLDTTSIRSIGGLEINNLSIVGCDNLGYLFISESLANNNIKNIVISNTNLSGILYSNFPEQRVNAFNVIDNVKIENCNVSNSLFWTPDIDTCGELDYSNIILNNVNYLGTNPIFNLYYNQNFNKIDIKNLNIINPDVILFKFNNVGNIISESKINTIINSTTLFNGSVSYTLNGVEVKNTDADTGFVAPKDSVLAGLSFDNCNFDSYLGLLDIRVNLKDSTFKNFKGTLMLNGELINLDNNTFYNGESSTGNGVVSINNESIFINKCTFERNKAQNGGAVFIAANSSQIINSRFISNTATVHGGAVFVSPHVFYYIDDAGMATISEVFESEADTKQNSLYRKDYEQTYDIVYVDSVASEYSNHVNNLMKAFLLVNPNGKIIFTTASQIFTFDAGSPRLSKSNVTITGKNTILNVESYITVSEYSNYLTFENIVFQGSPNHAIVWRGEGGTIKNCTFKDNGGETAEYGAALDIEANNLLIKDTTFSNNILDSSLAVGGGAIYFNASGLTIINCVFDNNMANTAAHIYMLDTSRDVKIDKTKFINGKPFNNGGSGIIMHGYNMTISNSEFENNRGSNGGALVFDTVRGKVLLESNKFTSNSATNGGAIIVTGCPDLQIKNNNFTSNSATNGGAVYVNGDRPVFTSNKFESNTATTGGAIYNNALVAINDCDFIRNTASGNGGAIYSNSGLTLSDSTFNGNRAVLGGAVYINGNANTLTNLEFVSNTATSDGSAVYVADNSAVTVNGLTVNSNTHPTNKYDVYFGNNVLFSVPVTGITLGQNQRINYGSYLSNVLYVSPSGTGANTGLSEADSTTFANVMNHITTGGKIIFLQGTYSDLINQNLNRAVTLEGRTGAIIRPTGNGRVFTINANGVVIQGLTFDDIFCSVDGGALNIAGGTVDVIDTTFTDNTATNGAAIYIAGGAKVSVSGSTFNKNTATSNGGAIYSAGTLTVTDSQFTANKGTNRHIHNTGTLTITGNTFETSASISASDRIYITETLTISGTYDDGINHNRAIDIQANGVTRSTNVAANSGTFSTTWKPTGAGNQQYTLTIVDRDNKNAYTQSASKTVYVAKKSFTLTLTVADNIAYGQNVVVTASGIPSDVTTNNIRFVIGTTTKTGTISSGQASATFTGLEGNKKYTVTAFYDTGSNYESTSVSKEFYVYKLATSFTVSAAQVYVDGSITVNLNFANSDASGTAYVSIGGYYTNQPVTVNKGKATLTLSNGIRDSDNHTISVSYSGDARYNGTSATGKVSVVKYVPNIEIIEPTGALVDGQATIGVKVTGNSIEGIPSGKVEIQVDKIENDKIYEYTLTQGTASHTVTVNDAGSYLITVHYESDRAYGERTATKSFTVSLHQPNLELTVNSQNIKADQYAVVTATVTGDTDAPTGYVIVTVNGKDYRIDLNNANGNKNSGSVNIDKLSARTDAYNVIGTYYGDRVYDKDSVDSGVSYTVSKYSPTVHVSVQEGTQVEIPTKIIITVDKTASVTPTGEVSILVDGNRVSRTLDNGRVEYTYTFRDSNYHPIQVSYLGDDYYDKSATNASAGVTPSKLNIDEIVIQAISNNSPYVDDTITVTAKATAAQGNLTGTITIVVGSQSETVTMDANGVASKSFKLSAKDTYEVSATYNGNYKYNSGAKSTTSTVTTKYITPTVDLQVSDVYVDGSVMINVTVSSNSLTDPKTPTGYVILHISDRSDVRVDLTGGKGSATVTFNEAKTHDVTAQYMGDYKFGETTSQAKQIVVSKYATEVSVQVVNVNVDGSVNVNVTVTSQGGTPEGSAVITVDNKDEYPIAALTGGKGNYTIKFTKDGTFAVTAEYKGNYKYLENEKTEYVTVSKLDPTVTVKNINAKVGDAVTIEVHVDGADGNINTGNANVTITIPDIGTYTVGVNENGDATKDITIPFSTTFHVTATYNGNYKYNQESGKADIFSSQWGTTIDVEVSDVQVDDTLTINITVKGASETPTGNVTLTVGNFEPVILDLTDGRTSTQIKFSEATVGSALPVTVSYNGDVRYSSNTNVEKTINVYKYDPTVNVELIENIKVDDTVVINVTVAHDAGNISGDITLTVTGDNMESQTFTNVQLVNGRFTQPVKFTRESDYQISIQYSGNYKYNSKSLDYTIHATKYATSLFIEVDENVMAGDTMIINITVNSTSTGNNGNISGTIVGAKIGNGKYDNDTIVLDENGKASITITNIREGKYDVVGVFNGNYKYQDTEFTTSFTVGKYDVDLQLTVQNTTTIGVAIFEVQATTTNYDHISGLNVTITGIPGGDRNITLDDNGHGRLEVVDIPQGIYPIGAYFYETYYYNYDQDSGRLFVNKTSIAGDDIAGVNFEISLSNIKVGQNVQVLVTVVGKEGQGTFHIPTGNITIRFDGKENGTAILNGEGKATLIYNNVVYGKHTVSVTYNGDNTYFPDIKSTQFFVDKWATEIDLTVDKTVKVGQPVHIHVKVNDTGVTNDVTFYIFGERHSISLTNGEGDYTIVAPAGTHTLPVVYGEDDKYWGSKANQNFTVLKNESSVEVNVNEFQVGQNATVNVIVKAVDTNSKAHPQGIVTVTINNKPYTVTLQNSTVDGQSIGSVVIDVLPAGSYPISAVYGSGPNYYGSSYNQTSLTINKNESSVLVEVEPIQVGQTAIVYVTVKAVDHNSKAIPQNYVVVEVGGQYANVQLDYDTGDGYAKGKHEFTGLTYGVYNVTASYTSGVNYGSSTNSSVQLTVNRNASVVIVNVKNVQVGQNATVNLIVKALDENSHAIPQGYVDVTVNGETYRVKLHDAEGQAEGSVTIPVLPAEYYNVAATYIGGPNYLGNGNSTGFNVIKNASQVILEVQKVQVGQNATVKVIVKAVDSDSKTHPQGTVRVKVGEDYYDVILSNSTEDGKSEGSVVVKQYPAYDIGYIVSATYSSGPNYDVSVSEDNAYRLVVLKNASKVSVYVADVHVGQNATVYVNVSAVDENSVAIPQGTVTITVGGENYVITLNDAPNGKYATGSTVIKALNARDHTVYAKYSSGSNYLASENNTFKFNVYKNESSVEVFVDNVQVGQNATVTVKVHALNDAEGVAIPQGNVTITIPGYRDYTITLHNEGNYATGSVTLDVMPAGNNYLIYATYNSGPNYLTSQNNTETFNVLKNQSQVIVTIDGEVRVGQNATVNVIVKSLNGGAGAAIPKGTVTITIDHHDYVIDLTDDVENNQAVGSKAIHVLTSGVWVVSATYSSGPNYNGNSSAYEFTVHKNESKVSVYVADVQVGQNATVYVNVSAVDPNSKSIPQGNVTFDVDGKTYTIFLHNATDGNYATGSITLDVLKHDERGYDFIAYYKSGPNYGESNSKNIEFMVNKNTTSIDFTVNPVLVEVNNTIAVKLVANSTAPTGEVRIIVNKKSYTIILDDGEGSVVIDKLPYTGQAYSVLAEYLGDENYESASAETEFIILRNDLTLTINYMEFNQYKVGTNTAILIKPDTSRLTEKLHVKLNGTEYDLDYNSELEGFLLENDTLFSGSHLILANYYGDDLYNAAVVNSTFTINKWDSSLDVKASNAYVGDDVNVKVEVTVTGFDQRYATGKVYVTVNGTVHEIELEEGKGSKDISGLQANNGYVVVAYYEGDEYFTDVQDDTARFDVYKRDTNVTVSVQNIYYHEDAIVHVTVGGYSNGTVSIYVNDTLKATVQLSSGVGKANIPDILTGVYNIRAEFEGDYKYLEAENSTTLEVYRAFPQINIEFNENDVIVSDDAYVNVTVVDATGRVTIIVDGVEYNSTLDDNHEYNIIIPGLAKGEYFITVHYYGDDIYEEYTTTSERPLIVRYANFEELKELIEDAIANNKTEIDLPYDYEFSGEDGTIEIPSNITINGNGHTIDAQGSSTIFNVTGDNVVLSNITIENVNGEENGAVVWSGNNGTIANTTFANNTAPTGGAITITGNGTTIADSTFTGNNATTGGAVVIEGNNATIEGSTFTGNNAEGEGAGIYSSGNGTTIKDTEFAGNDAGTGAGAVLNGDNAKVENATFTQNNAETGAGVVIGGNNATVADSTFANNTAETGAGVVSEGTNTTISGSEFTGNNATTGAGAVLNGANATVAGSTFAGNNATEGAGVVSNGNGTSIKDTEFANNTAETGAGAVLNGNGANVDNASFTGNEAQTGAGIVATGNNTEITGTTFANNTAETGAGVVSNGTGTSISDSNFTGNNANSGAGAVLNGANATVAGSTFAGNNATEGAGVVSNGEGTNITGSTFANNTATTGAGAVLKGNNATVEGTNFTGNKAETGAGVVSEGNGTSITGSEFTGNNATTGAGAVLNGNNASVEGSTFAGNTAETGAGIVSEGNGTSISGTEFTGNNATTGAGAVLNGNDAAVSNSTFAGNTAETGAGIVSEGNGTSISGTEFANNTADTGAGAVLNGNGATVENTTFVGNNATTGAGVVSNGEGTNISGSTFANNTATTGAGAVLNGANATVGETEFTGNNATSGSAIALGDNATSIKVDDATQENMANGNNTGSTVVKNPTITLELPELVKVGYDAIITVTVDGAKGTVTLFVDEAEYSSLKLDDNNKVIFAVSGLTKGKHTIRAVYNGFNGTEDTLGEGLLGVDLSEEIAPGFKTGEIPVIYSTFKDLQKLIDEAVEAGNKTINLKYDYEYNIGDDSNSVLIVPDGITINGNNHFVSGAGESIIFNITGNDVTLKNIILKDAKGEDGGAIIWSGNNGAIENATLANNSAENGGAILWTGDNATIKDTTFENNTATTGGAVLIEGNNATVEGSTFTGNNATEGAGIVSNGNGTTIRDTEFTQNTAEEGAGVILNGNDANVDNATFVGNEADNGAGIVTTGNNTQIVSSTFENNTAFTGAGVVSNGTGTLISDSNFTGNNANSGAGVILSGDNATVAGSEFTGNDAVNGAGIITTGNNTKVEDTKFANNTAQTGAGVLSEGSNTTISGSEFTGNTAETGAGAVLNGDNATVEGSTFTGNDATEGAGIISNANGTTIKNTEFANNTAQQGAGAVLNGNDANVANATFTGNEADNGAGIVATGDNVEIKDSTFANNTAITGAGVVSNGTGTSISGSNFTGNNANSGAGVILNGENASVENATFSGNQAVNGAGVVSNGNGTTIKGTEFTNNTAETGAGAILNGDGAKVENATFAGNNATTGAGAVLNGNNASVADSTFANNTAETGAGIVSEGNGTSISGTEFTGNNAATGAGAVLNGNGATVENTTFAGNNATTGAGVVSNGEGTNITGSTFANNTAITGAGAILNGANATVAGSNFTGNNASSGSAIALGDNASDVNVDNATKNNMKTGNNTGEVMAKSPTIIIDAPIVKIDDDAIITVTVNNAEGNVVLYIDGIEVATKALEDHSAIFTIPGLSKGTYALKVEYIPGENSEYAYGFNNKDLVVKYSDFKDLQKLIQDAIDAGEDTIVLKYNYEFDVNSDEGPVVIAKDGLTIDGAGHWISGADVSTIFDITGKDVTIKNIQLINAKGEEGGAIIWSGDNGVIDNATLANNTAQNGGAIKWTGDNATIKDSTFENNSASTGGAVVIEGKDATVEGSTFTANNATNGAGIVSNGEGTTIKDTEFTGNHADEQGAGVILNGNNANVDNATFVGNEADNGAGIVTTGNNTQIVSSTFENNTAVTGAGVVSNGTGTLISDSNFTGNNANSGAGVVLEGDNATVTGSEFTGNEAEYGAGIVTTGDNTKVEDTKFANNTADTGAGIVSEGSNTTISGSEFTGNTAETGAGAVLNGDNATVEGSTFTGNEADNGAGVVSNGEGTSIKDTEFANNTADEGAGAVLNGNGAKVDNATFTGNEADNGAGIVATGDNVEIKDSTFANNTAITGAGVVSNGTGTSISGSNFTGNNAESGAGVLLEGDNATVTGSEFTGNEAVNGAGIVTTGDNTKVEDTKFANNTADTGAGIVSKGSNTTISGSEFTGNNATTGAGAVLNGADATVEGSTFAGNNATEGAGVVSNGEGISIKDTEFANNTADEGAGAVLNGNGAKVDNATFTGNEADNGAGIVATGDNVEIKDSTFANNTAITGAGVVSNGTGTSISGSNFTGNNANSGAGVLLEGDNATVAGSEFTGNEAVNGAGIVTTGNNTKVEDTKFTNNTAETGAGVLSEGSNTTISGSEFTGNNATTGAGAVLNGANASVEGSTFAGNNATEGAGVVSNGEGISIKDTEFANNTAQQGAGAVLNGNDASVANATFTGNEADNGAGIVATGDNANVANSTFANNTAMTGAGIVSNGTGTSISGSNFTGNNANSGAGVVLSGDNATVENAKFSGNQAVNGAGIVSNGNGTSIKGTEFTNNTAETGAGAILNGANATVEGSTFAGNNATEGAGVVSNGEGTSIKDTEFANNTAQSGAGAVLNGNGASVSNATFAGNNATTGAGIVSNGNGTNVTGSTFANNTAETGAGIVVNGANSTIGNSSFTGNNATDSGSAISVGGNATGTDIKEDNKAENNTAAGQKDTNLVTYYATVTVDPINTIAVGDDVTITVNVKGDGIGMDGKVIITVNGANYESNLTNGKAVFTVSGIMVAGSYNVTVSYINDTIAQKANAQAELNVYNNASIAADDMTRGYNSGKDFEATFVDKYGNPLANTDVQFTVDGKVYTVRTDANGHAVLNVKLAAGKHTVVVRNPSDGSTITKSVTIVKSIQSNSNKNIFYLDGSTYKVRVYGADGKVVGAGQIVTFKVNGKTYKVKTDKNGWATLKLNIKTLVPKNKKYTVTAAYNGFTVKNTIKVKQVIKAKKTTSVKKSKKLLKIKITLKGKKVYKKKALKVKFKGKTYKLKTNKKGVATLKLKQNVLKKLKAGKKYKYTIIYQKAKLTRYIKVKR